MAQIRLIVGLGNPGSEYEDTRHNAGFWFVDQLARRENTFFREEKKFQAEVARVRLAGQDVWLLKPTTYMNRSGLAVVALALYYKILPEEILVVHDELDLMPGCMKIKKGEIPINPYVSGSVESCTYCAYKDVCGFDEKMPGHKKRNLEKDRDTDYLEKMKEKIAAKDDVANKTAFEADDNAV